MPRRTVGAMGRNRIYLGVLVVWALAAPLAPGAPGATATPPECAFDRRSYAPGETAVLVVWSGTGTTVRIERVGHTASRNGDPLAGAPVTPPRGVGSGRRLRVRIGDWPSGLYVAGCAGPGGEGLRAVRRPAEAARRAPGRGRAADEHLAGVQPPRRRRERRRRQLVRALAASRRVDLGAAVPRPGRAAAASAATTVGFLRWLALHGAEVGLPRRRRPRARRDGRLRWRARYDLIVFPGHEEYVTTHAYDVIERLPRPRRQPRLSLGEQLLLPRRAARPAPVQDAESGATSAVPKRRSIGVQYVDGTTTATRTSARTRSPAQRRGAAGCSRAPAAERGPLRALRDRDRREDVQLAARDQGARTDRRRSSAPARRARDDLLRDGSRREGVRRGRDELRRLGTVAGRLPDGREHLAAAGAPEAQRFSTIPKSLPRPTR